MLFWVILLNNRHRRPSLFAVLVLAVMTIHKPTKQGGNWEQQVYKRKIKAKMWVLVFADKNIAST